MKILILANNDVGLYKFRRELILKLIKDGHKVCISLPKGDFVTNLVSEGCHFIDTKIDRRGMNPIKDINLFCKYISIIRNEKPSVVLSYTIKPNLYGSLACRINKTPYINNITGLGSLFESKNPVKNIVILLQRFALKKSKCIFFQNKENMNVYLQLNIGGEKNKLIPGSGVNLQHFNLLDYPPAINTEFVFIARIMKEKGVDQYIEAAKYIRNKYPNTVFHICGFCEEEYGRTLHNLQKQGIIIYHGMQRDVREILKKTHCTIHPTYYPEGLSNVLLESAACGRPIISTNRSGCREVIDDGVNGYIVNQKDSQDLINKIEIFLNLSHEQKRQMGLAGRKKVEKEFDRQIVVEAYMREIERDKQSLISMSSL